MSDRSERIKLLAHKDQVWASIRVQRNQIMKIGLHGIRDESDALLCRRICGLLTADYFMDEFNDNDL